jgi:hypothetical protein
MNSPIGVLKRLPAPGPELWLPDLLELLDSMVESAEPAVVFSSVARLCVPTLSSQVSIAITEGDEQNYLIAHPVEQSRPGPDLGGEVAFGGIRVSDDCVVTEIHGDAVGSHAAFRGVMVLQLAEPASMDALVAQLIVERAVAIIAGERLTAIADAQQARADNLEQAMHTSREIGIAIGIVMSRHKLTQVPAFELLRMISQETNRKVRDIALDVIIAGDVELPPRLSAGPTA